MRRIIPLILLALCTLARAQTRPIGMNPNAERDYSPQCMYSDAVRTARIDVNGKPLRAGPTTWPTGNVRVWVARDIPKTSSGRWLIRAKGGALQFTTASVKPLPSPPPTGRYLTQTIKVYSDGKTETKDEPIPEQDSWWSMDVPADTQLVFFDVKITSAPQYLRAYRPGILAGPTASEPPKFNPKFIALLAPFPGFVRGMDLLDTNSSPIVNFADYPGPDSITYNGGDDGRACISPRDFFQLCNELKRDPYYCSPHKATTQCVRDVAVLAKATLDSDRKLWWEHSNETWNYMAQFQQFYDLQAEAKALVAAGDTALKTGSINEFEYRWRLHARRSAQTGGEAAKIFGRDRTIIALGCHGEEAWWSNRMMEFLKTQGLDGSIDILMIAPYMGDSKKTTTRPARSVDEVFAGRDDIPGLLSDEQCSTGWNERGTEHLVIANRWGKRLGFYEYGIGFNRWDAITRAAQSDPRMGLVVTKYESYIPPTIPRGWFNLATDPNTQWGLIIGDNVPTAKYDALVRAAQSN